MKVKFSKKQKIWILIFSALAVYLPSIKGDWLWDDHHHIVYNKALQRRSLSIAKPFERGYWQKTTIKSISGYYRPISMFVDFLNAKVTGVTKIGFHSVNILIHLLTVYIFFQLLLVISDEKRAFWFALIFAVHPAWSESVLFASARVDSLSALLSFTTFLFFLKKEYYKSAVFFIIAILTKENAVMLLPIFCAYLLIKKEATKKQLLYLSGIVAFLVIRIYIFPRFVSGLVNPGLSLHPDFLKWDWFKVMFYQIGTYFRLVFFPYPLGLLWGNKPNYVFLGYLFFYILLALSGVGVVRLFRKWDNMVFYLIAFVLAVLPGTNIFYLPYIIAEHHLYFAGPWLLLMLSARVTIGKYTKTALIIIVLILSGMTLHRSFMFQSGEKVYLNSLKYHKNSDSAYSLLATVYLDENHPDTAFPFLKKAIELDPSDLASYINLSNYYILKNSYKKAYDTLFRAKTQGVYMKFPKYFLNYYIVSRDLGKEMESRKNLMHFKKLMGPVYASYVRGQVRVTLKNSKEYADAGRFDYALALIKAAELLPVKNAELAFINLHRAQILIEMGRLSDAQKILSEVAQNKKVLSDSYEIYDLYKKLGSDLDNRRLGGVHYGKTNKD